MALTLEERLMIEYLRRQGYSIRRISRELGISRITVKRYLENPQKGKYCRVEPYISKLNSYKEYIESRLKDYPDITAEKLYREIKERRFEGSYRAVAYYVGKNRPLKEQEVFLRYETEPGEQVENLRGRVLTVGFFNYEKYSKKESSLPRKRSSWRINRKRHGKEDGKIS